MDKNDHLVFCAFLSKNFPLVNDHPDVAGLLRDPYILENLGAAMANTFHDEGITKVIAPEARGPVLGALVATYLKAGLVLVRKEGRTLPTHLISHDFRKKREKWPMDHPRKTSRRDPVQPYRWKPALHFLERIGAIVPHLPSGNW